MARKSEVADETDKKVGIRLRELRMARGLSQIELAVQMGVSHQQLHKYEKASNRLTAGRLMMAANALGASISHFFDEITDAADAHHQNETRELMRHFSAIKNPKQQEAISLLIRRLADVSPGI